MEAGVGRQFAYDRKNRAFGKRQTMKIDFKRIIWETAGKVLTPCLV
jgi:hypothetical protein